MRRPWEEGDERWRAKRGWSSSADFGHYAIDNRPVLKGVAAYDDVYGRVEGIWRDRARHPRADPPQRVEGGPGTRPGQDIILAHDLIMNEAQ